MADLFLSARLTDLLRPDELAVAVEFAEVDIAAILATIWIDQVAVTVACAVTPLTSVL